MLIKQLCLVFFVVLIQSFVVGQDVDCSKYKTGLFQNIDSEDGPTTFVKRKRKYQFEINKKSNTRIKLRVYWIDCCTYRLKFIKGNRKWRMGKHVPNNPDLIVKIIETGEDYYVQIAKFEGMEDFKYRSHLKRIK